MMTRPLSIIARGVGTAASLTMGTAREKASKGCDRKSVVR